MKKFNPTKFLLIALFVLFAPLAASAQYATVNNAYISEDDYTLSIYADMDISGCLNQDVQIITYYYFSNDQPLKDYNGVYNTADGNVSGSTVVCPGYSNATFEEIEISIPFDELHLATGQTHSIRIMIRAYCNGRFIDDNSNIYDITISL